MRLTTNPEEASCPSHREYKINSMEYAATLVSQNRQASQQAKRLLGGLYGRMLSKHARRASHHQRRDKENGPGLPPREQLLEHLQARGIFSRQICVLRNRLATTLAACR